MKKGFTLIEVIASIAIISLLATALFLGFRQVNNSELICDKNKSANRHILNIQENLIALKNTDLLNPDLYYYNLDMVDIFNSLNTGNDIEKELISPEGVYELKIKILDKRDKYSKLNIRLKDHNWVDKELKVAIYSIGR